MAMINKQSYITKFRNLYSINIVNNNSVGIILPTIARPAFTIIGIHKLTPSENAGNHNLYMDVIDKNGKRLYEKIEWGWLGQRPNERPQPVTLDKPDNEPAGNIVIWGNQTIWAKVLGKTSDSVTNIHTQLADEGPGNTYGHFSYYVVWMLVDDIIEPIPVPPPDTDDCSDIQAELNKANKTLTDIRKLLEIK